MISKLVVCAGLLFLVSCAGALPEVSSVLERANEAYQTAKGAREALESVYTQACIPPIAAEAVDPCSRIRVALDKAAKAEGKAYEALAVAVDVLNEINSEE